VFQNYALFPHMDVFGNVAFGLVARRATKAEQRRRVAATLALVELGGMERRRVGELSGGQQQRVALARALVIEPTLLLLDEPLSNLDAQLRVRTGDELRALQRRLGITTIYVTHDQTEALSLCDRLAVIRAGRCEQVGTPEELFLAPATGAVADFLGRANVLPVGGIEQARAARDSGTCDGGWIATVGPHRLIGAAPLPSGPVRALALRPHALRVVPAGAPLENVLPARVVDRRFLGADVELVLVADALPLVARLRPTDPGSDLRPGDSCALHVPPDALWPLAEA